MGCVPSSSSSGLILDVCPKTVWCRSTPYPISHRTWVDRCLQAPLGPRCPTVLLISALDVLLSSFEENSVAGCRPSKSLFQIARGSGATLSECTFSSKKRTSLRRLLQERTTSRPHDKKKPDRAISEFFLKNPGTCSGTFQRRIRAISRQDPPAPCSK